jgi:hypothetical protein
MPIDLARRARSFALRTNLVREGDVLLGDGARADGVAARAWMPTPRALAAIASAGAIAPDAPALEVLRRLNDRTFAFELGPRLDGAVLARSIDEALATLARPVAGGTWLLKRPFTFAGRGQLRATCAGLALTTRAFVQSSIEQSGSVVIEPLCDRTADFAIHGHLDPTGALVLGDPTRPTCDVRGVWRATELAAPGDLTDDERALLLATGAEVAAALSGAGYFGPFGVDAFRYTDPDGRSRFHPLCEINARYTMGFAIGMGDHRPDRGDR